MFSLGCSTDGNEDDDFFKRLEDLFDSSIAPSSANNSSSSGHRRNPKVACTLQERHARNLEKNRKAQKRFREKQKNKFNILEQQVEDLTSKLQKVEIEKKVLQERSEFLEKFFQDKGAPVPSSSTFSAFQHEPLDQAADSEQVKQAEGSFYLESLQRSLTSDMIRNLDQPQIQKYFLEVWELMIAEMEVRLKEADVPLASPEKMRKLDLIVAEYRLCMMRMAVINPIGMKLLGVQSRFNPAKYVRNVSHLDQITKDVIPKLELSSEQKKAIIVIWKNFCELQSKCMRERLEIGGSLQSSGPRQDMQWEYYQDFMMTHSLVFRVRENWRKDYKNHWEFMRLVAQLLTPLQFARFFSFLKPLVPDFFVFCRMITEEQVSIDTQHMQQLRSSNSNQSQYFVFGQQPSLDLDGLLESNQGRMDIQPFEQDLKCRIKQDLKRQDAEGLSGGNAAPKQSYQIVDFEHEQIDILKKDENNLLF